MKRIMIPRRALVPGLLPALVLGFLCACRADAAGKVFLNEVGVIGNEGFELYNLGPDPVDISGWSVQGSDGSYTFPSGTIINPGVYLSVGTPPIHDDIGGEIFLIDSGGGEQDGVQYGQQGSAPLAQGGASLARAPDGSANPPRDPVDDAPFWTVDFSPTPGGRNDAPVPILGGIVEINEVNDDPPETDVVEFYNETALLDPISLVGWRLSDGHTAAMLTGVVQGGDVLALSLGTDIEITRLAYLFTNTGVRVDQVGLAGAPLADMPCIGRCPDGAGPNKGYDYETSGGGATWIPMTCSPGQRNILAPECYASDVHDAPERAPDPDSVLQPPEPNPAPDSVRLRFLLPRPGDVLLEIITAAGTRKALIVDRSLPAGAHALRWDTRDLHSGVYFVRLTYQGWRETRTLVVAH